MVYILHTYLKNRQKVIIALQEIYGIGSTLAQKICDNLGLNYKIKIHQLTNLQLEQLTRLLSQNSFLGSPLKRSVESNIERLIRISSYRGFRHTQRLPARGQRTSTNAQTCRRIG